MNILIGNTGLVGTTLKKSTSFDFEFNSSNIHEYIDKVPDGCNLFLACLPGTKWLVNKNVKKDLDNIQSIFSIISTKKYNNINLISTIDVYCDSSLKSNEKTIPTVKSLSYGTNRYLFERMINQLLDYEDLMIFRLPALFSKDFKKNALYDLLNNNNVEKVNINSVYQWYNLDYLYGDILFYQEHKNTNQFKFNLFSQGVRTKKIVEELFPEHLNKVQKDVFAVNYDFCTELDKSGYLYTEEESFQQIKEFVNEYRNKPTSF
jgi:hypothetical protein